MYVSVVWAGAASPTNRTRPGSTPATAFRWVTPSLKVKTVRSRLKVDVPTDGTVPSGPELKIASGGRRLALPDRRNGLIVADAPSCN